MEVTICMWVVPHCLLVSSFVLVVPVEFFVPELKEIVNNQKMTRNVVKVDS